MKVLKIFSGFLLLFVTNALHAQDLSGTWVGTYSNLPAAMVPPQKILIEITVYNDSLITGASHLYYTRGRFEHHKLNGKYNKQQGIVIISEDSVIGVKVGAFTSVHEGVYTMNLSSSPGRYTLEGRWVDKKRMLFSRPKVDVHFLKKIETTETTSTDSTNITPPTVLSRVSDIQHLFEINERDADSVKVEIVDNGIIDGDTVSVYLDNRQLIRNVGLTEKAVSFSFSLDKTQPIQKLKMVAENMGSIPPNTALFIITIGGKRHNIYLSSDMQKNAVVEFFLKN